MPHARELECFRAKINPVVRKVRKINTPVLGLFLHMCFEAEPIRATRLADEKAFMIGTVMFIRDPTINREERRKKSGRAVGRRNRRIRDRKRSGWDRQSHVGKRNRCQSAIVEQDLIRRRTQRIQRHRDIHHRAREKHISGGVHALHPSARGIGFFNRYILVPK